MAKEFTEKEIKKLRHLLIQEHMPFVLQGTSLLESQMDGMSFAQFKATIQRITKKRKTLVVERLSFKEQKNIFISFPRRNYLGLWIMGMFAGSSELAEQGGTIKKLSLTSCKLEALPISMANFRNLEQLDLSYNRLVELPEVIRTFLNLEKLFIDNNRLIELPEWIGDAKNLKTLDISGNPIEEFPEKFGQLIQLEELFMASTRIREVPNWMGKFEALNWLSVKGSIVSGVELEILSRLLESCRIEF